MDEDFEYMTKEFYFSYPSRQKEARKTIARLCAEKNISLEELSSKANISLEDLEEMMFGNRRIFLSEFKKICEALN